MMRFVFSIGLLLGAAMTLADTAFDAAQARQDYMLNCQGCHLPDGSGYAGKVPNLRGELGRFLRVEGGREFLVRVPGSATSALPDDRLAQVLNWMLREFSASELPADFSGYRADEIALWRRQPYTEVNAVRATLIERIAALATGAVRPQ